MSISAAGSEEQLRARVLELAAGGAVPEELLLLWTEARRESAAEVRSLPLERAQKALRAELQAIDSQLRRLEEGAAGSRREAFEALAQLGGSLRWTLWLGDITSGELTVDPLALLAEDLDQLEARARELAALEPRLKLEARTLDRRAQAAKRALLEARAERYVKMRPAAVERPLEEASALWQSAAEAFQVELSSLQEVRGAGDPEEAEPRAPAALEPLRARRAADLGDCGRALERCSPLEAAEFAHGAAADLLDQASAILSESAAAHPRLRLPALELLRQRIDGFLELLGPWRGKLGRRGLLGKAERRRFRKDLRQLAGNLKRIRNAESEARVHLRLERSFGRRQVRLFEGFILLLIFGFLSLVVIEGMLPDAWPWLPAIYAADLVFCLCFQIDFLVRWGFSGWSGSYFLRHFFLESLPALPYGFVFHQLGQVEGLRAVILARLLRLRFVILPAARLFRIGAFFVRGADRAVERFRHLLDRDILLFDHDPLSEAMDSPLRRQALALESRRSRCLRSFYAETPREERAAFARRQLTLLEAETRVTSALELPYRRAVRHGRGEVHIERIISAFLDCDVARAAATLGRDGARRLARWIRFVTIPGFRRAPVIRRLAPAARLLNPTEAVSAAANAIGQVLQEFLGVLRFWGDLSGITTGPQILDRIGTAIVIASRSPAMRLIFVGLLFLLFKGLANLTHLELLQAIARPLGNILGLPLLVLGAVGLSLLFIGFWFKRISGEALDLYLRTADAQFYPLLKARKLRRLEQDLQLLYRSVMRPEAGQRDNCAASEEEWIAFLAEPIRARTHFLPRVERPADPRFAPFAEDRETIALLYRDFLDGPVLHRSDDKSSVQLLGNLAIQEIRCRTLGMRPRELRKLERLDLEKGSILALGPYFWFRFITESLAIETAKLILEYNTTCIPRDRMHLAAPEARERFEEFLAEHRGPVSSGLRRRSERRQHFFGAPLATSSFTAFDFLCATPESDEEVRRRYGEEVLDALKKDRRGVVRDIFGTRPYHLLPRTQRAVNPYRFYHKYLGGGRFVLLPLVLFFVCLRLALAGLRQVGELVEEVLGRKRILRSQLSRIAGFDVAVRKINRMRKPFFMEALRLRAAMDIEYLDLRLPGDQRVAGAITFRDDLDFIGALESERKPIEELRERALKDLRRFRLFLSRQGWTGEGVEKLLLELDPSGELLRHRGEVMRALVTAYITDHDSLRSRLSAPDWAREFIEEAIEEAEPPPGTRMRRAVFCGLLGLRKRRRELRRLFREYVELSPELRVAPPAARRKVLRRLLASGEEAERLWRFAVEGLRREAGGGDCAVREALKRAARDYALWTRKLITLRAVQTLTVLDIRAYRDMVWETGGYAEE
jgi:hypothetical protein